MRISTVFDHDRDSPHHFLYCGSIRSVLKKILEENQDFAGRLPMIKWMSWGKEESCVSIFFLCRHQPNGVKFFYEMISRFLLPGKRLKITAFFSTDFELPDVMPGVLTVAEAVVATDNSADRDLALHQLPILESEICLGLTSVYHANRILEIKGLSADEKTSIIQERIVSLLERRPQDFDHAIFLQMQHFLVMCSEEFKAVRGHAHLSRIIYAFYHFRKKLKWQMEVSPGHRFISVKLTRTSLYLPFGMKKVLGVFIALHLQNESELFEEKHLVRVLRDQFVDLSVIEGSFFFRDFKEERIQLLYLEVEKENGGNFTLAEVKEIRERLPEEVVSGIEKLARPLFMPRNEEEVMRNIITLSNQLKFPHDLPQVIISFDGQTEEEVIFSVIWMRALKEGDLPVQKTLEMSNTALRFIPEKIRQVGILRKKYPKEVTLFKVKTGLGDFLRLDQSVDLFKARRAIVEQLKESLGDFRDYNGGMIAKQHEQYVALKNLFPHLSRAEEGLLEMFFHSIVPVEMRSLSAPQILKKMFTLLLEAVQKNREEERGEFFFLKTEDCCLISSDDSSSIEKFKALQAPSNELLMFSLHTGEFFYLGIIDLDDNKKVLKGWEDLTFELQTITL